jgi:uncharacterized protein YndB with AHSA1/START domain
MGTLIAALAAAAILAGTTAPISQTYPGVSDTSFTAGNGDHTMRLSVDIAVDPPAVWHALSTADGWRALSVKTAYVDFRQGGEIETNYKAGSPKGSLDNIKNQIIAFAPDRLLVFRNVQAPRGFKDADLFGHIVTAIAIEPLGPGHSRVTLSEDGYAPTPGFDALYGKFLDGNAYTLAGLRDALAKSSVVQP